MELSRRKKPLSLMDSFLLRQTEVSMCVNTVRNLQIPLELMELWESDSHGDAGLVGFSQLLSLGCWNILEFQAEQAELEKLTEPASRKIYSPQNSPKIGSTFLMRQKIWKFFP